MLTRLLLIGVLLAPAARVEAQAPDSADKAVAALMAAQRIPGVAVAVVRGGQVIKAKGYGFADLEHQIPVTPETVFKIGSVAKQFLATGIMLLVQDGKLSVDDPVSKYIPGTPESWQGITIRNFLTHTSGVVREGPAFDGMRVQADSIVIKSAFAQPLQFPIGSKYQYCNVCYFTLADIITRVSGQPWDAFIAERVFAPNGMSASRTTTTTALVPRRARGYVWRTDHFENAMEVIALRPSGAFLSNVLDLAKWEAALHTERTLTKASRDAMWSPMRLTSGTMSGYGFGWSVDTLGGRSRIHHGGSLPGFRAMMMRYPNDSLTVIVLTNADGANPDAIAREVARPYFRK